MSIKQQLIEEIEKIDDQIILEQLTALLKDSDQSFVVEFNDSQSELIEKSQQQYKDGKIHNHEDIMKMISND